MDSDILLMIVINGAWAAIAILQYIAWRRMRDWVGYWEEQYSHVHGKYYDLYTEFRELKKQRPTRDKKTGRYVKRIK